MGPRGLHALEKLVLNLLADDSLSQLKLLLFEQTGQFGNGQVYDTTQVLSNWINIPERELRIDLRPGITSALLNLPSFPSYHQWIGYDSQCISELQVDTYPPRSSIGKYLQRRFESLAHVLVKSGIVTISSECVVNVQLMSDDKYMINTHEHTYAPIDEILLTIGHQPTTPSKELLQWADHAEHREHIRFFRSPYPIESIISDSGLTPDSTIGIRGFGLAMIDVVRGVADKYGQFNVVNEQTRACEYRSRHRMSDLFLPYSLDGLPLSPKPLNELIDNWFAPDINQVGEFEQSIKNRTIQKAACDAGFLIEAFAPIAARTYLNLPQTRLHEQLTFDEIVNLSKQWLADQAHAHPVFIPQSNSVVETMQEFVRMACGAAPISLDFCVGQVWRHLQPSMYDKLSFNECTANVFAQIISLDERMKRYAFGPPVESIQQLLALIDSGVMSLRFLNNPEIKLVDNGWLFNNKREAVITDILIDSVLDSPNINIVSSEILQQMRIQELINPVHDDLGVKTTEEGYLVTKRPNNTISVALLGRLAKGTIIGVDALIECFGKRPQRWAKAAADRHSVWLKRQSVR